MKKTLLLCCGFLVLAAPAAFAGLDLTAVACNTGPGHTSTFAFDCTAAGVPQQLFACMQLGTAQDSVVAVDNAFDLIVADPGLPTWWHFEPGGCNNLTGLGDATVFGDLARNLTACPSASVLVFWGTGGSAGPVAFTAQTHGANTGHFFLSISRPTPVNLTATGNYFVCNLNFLSDNATQSGGTCAGCGIGATLVWNSADVGNIRAAQRIGPEANPFTVSGPGLVSNCANWGAGAPNGCQVTATQSRTWGQLKSLYR